MRTTHHFLIKSDGNRHGLFMDGNHISSFPTFDAAEAEANNIARRADPGVSLRFELDLKSNLMDLEIRSATMERDDPE
jgi:hypothetical protein